MKRSNWINMPRFLVLNSMVDLHLLHVFLSVVLNISILLLLSIKVISVIEIWTLKFEFLSIYNKEENCISFLLYYYYLLRTFLVIVLPAQDGIAALGRVAQPGQVDLWQFRNLLEEARPGWRLVRRYPVVAQPGPLTLRLRLRIIDIGPSDQQLGNSQRHALRSWLGFRPWHW